ncbi:hypothetical protein ACFO9Q_08170 [Paenibacillus sp. GCM10023252]|uniref:hypothetical protein n=1 Tax=Paenibacillus sp. GCM10023252 TaxID=3252649 RepID=UPI003616D779
MLSNKTHEDKHGLPPQNEQQEPSDTYAFTYPFVLAKYISSISILSIGVSVLNRLLDFGSLRLIIYALLIIVIGYLGLRIVKETRSSRKLTMDGRTLSLDGTEYAFEQFSNVNFTRYFVEIKLKDRAVRPIRIAFPGAGRSELLAWFKRNQSSQAQQ